MSTQYFILTKPENSNIGSVHDDNIIRFSKSRDVYLLPTVNIQYYMEHSLFEKHLIEWCKQFCSPTRIFLDIGSHTGTFAISLARSSLCVHAFEPQRATYNALCGGIALSGLSDKVFAHPFGLGEPSQVGDQTLNIISNDGGGSTLHHYRDTKDPVLATETISVRTLDSFGLSNVGFIKMDVEDNELCVLKGAQMTIEMSNYPPFIYESNGHNNELVEYITQEMKYNIQPIYGCNNMFLATKPTGTA